jgi:hypothetical protein
VSALRLRSLRAPLGLVLPARCGSSGALTARTQPTETVRVSLAGQTQLATSSLRDDHAATVAAPFDAVSAALPAAVDSLGTPVKVRDAASGGPADRRRGRPALGPLRRNG